MHPRSSLGCKKRRAVESQNFVPLPQVFNATKRLSWPLSSTSGVKVRREGQVHRLKLLKRQSYGRAGFDLLRHRVLAHSA